VLDINPAFYLVWLHRKARFNYPLPAGIKMVPCLCFRFSPIKGTRYGGR